jgi:peptidoglycan/xylan/chitin deacetylase (PgdA/CDA1 family)
VADLGADPHGIAVTPRHFAEQLDVLRHHHTTLALTTLGHALERGTLPRRGAVITFDDGYADNLTAAAPLLERADLPATVFVTTGFVGQHGECWWDTLERVLLEPGRLPGRLALAIDGTTCQWSLGPGADYSQDDYARHRGWTWRQGQPPTVRHRMFRELFEGLQPLEEAVRQPVIRDLREWAGTPETARPTHRTLTVEELVRLNAHPLIELGAHSVSHPVFRQASPARQREEIEESRSFLERTVGAPITSFAYPYGDPGGAASLVADAGFALACTTEAGLVFHGHDRFTLPRLFVGDWDGDEFARELGRWT